MSIIVLMYFLGELFFIKKSWSSRGGWGGGESTARVRVGVGGDKEIWTQLICVGADYFL